MEKVQDFMLLFPMEPANQQPTEEQLREMKQQWEPFIGRSAAQAKLESTSRFGFDGNIIDKTVDVTSGINVASKEMLTGNMVVKAATLNEAKEIAKDCPVLTMGGFDRIEKYHIN